VKVPSDDLEKLMNTLSSREKGYFKTRINKLTGGKEDNALKLFEHLESKKSIKDYPNYAQNKFQLYQRLLTSLHNFHSFNSEKEKLKKNIHVIELLIERELRGQAKKLLNKSKKIALKYEYFNSMLELLILEKKIRGDGHSYDAIYSHYNEAKKYLNLSLIREEYWVVQQTVHLIMSQFGIIHNNPEAQKLLDEVKSNHILKTDLWKNSAHATLHFFHGMAIIGYLEGNYVQTHKYHKKYVETYDEHPFLFEIQPQVYIIGYNNYLIDCSLIKAYDEFEEKLNYLEEFVKKPLFKKVRNVESLVYKMTIVSRLDMLYMSFKFGKGYPFLKDLKPNFKKHKIRPSEQLALRYLAGGICFFLKKFDEANDWIVDLLQNPDKKSSVEIVRHSRILNLLIQLELGNYQYLEYLIKNTKRTLKKEYELTSTEEIIFHHIQQLIKGSPSAQKSIWVSFKESILSVDEKDKIFTFIHLKRWIKER